MPSRVQLFGPDDRNTTIWSPGSEQSPDGCANVYSSLFVEGYFYKICPTGQSSNQLYLTLPAGFVSSTISQEDATQAARELLAAKGQELAEAQGTCSLGEFQEIFSTVDATYNWDWVADKATIFPTQIKNSLPDGNSYGTGEDSGVIVEFPIGNTLSWPLMVGFFYSGTNLFLADTSLGIAPSNYLGLDIHDDYGLLHLDLKGFQHSTHPDLNVLAGHDSNDYFAINLASTYTFQNTVTYMGKLVADFGGREIYGPDWDAEIDGPGDNPFEPNPDQVPEFTVATLGGFLFRIDTASRAITNGKLAGVYLVCYKEDIQVYKYNAGLDDYESLYTIPFNPKNTTTYFGCSILFDGTNKVAEIYIDGQFELSIPDDTLLNIHLPICYMRGFTSVDHWVGDITTGVTYPGTNRLPPPITTRYFEPAEIQNPSAASSLNPEQFVLLPSDVIGAETELEANAPFPNLAAGSVEVGFQKDLIDYTAQIDSAWGTAFFGAAASILTRFDPYAYPEIGEIMWGAHALKVGKIEFNRYTTKPGTPESPYKYLPTAYAPMPLVPVEDMPITDWENYALFFAFIEAYQQPIRWSCSWDGVFQPSDQFPDSAEEEGSVGDAAVSDYAKEVIEAGLYRPAAVQTSDGWLYITSMINMLPGRVFTDLGTGDFKDVLSKEDLSKHFYFFSQGWFGSQTFPDIFSAIRTVKLMTGVQGKRTSEVLTGPVYDYNFRCPLPPVEEPPINIHIPCVERTFEVTGTFVSELDFQGNTRYRLVPTFVRDCLFGDPIAEVCYPNGGWSDGFAFLPVILDLPNNFPFLGRTMLMTLEAQPTELVHSGVKIGDKLTNIPRFFGDLELKVYREDWPSAIFSSGGLNNFRFQDAFTNNAAGVLAYETFTESCYFATGLFLCQYDMLNPIATGSGPVVAELGVEFKFVFSLPG